MNKRSISILVIGLIPIIFRLATIHSQESENTSSKEPLPLRFYQYQSGKIIEAEIDGKLVRNKYNEISAILDIEARPVDPSSHHTLRIHWDPSQFELSDYCLMNKTNRNLEIIKANSELVIYIPPTEAIILHMILKSQGVIAPQYAFTLNILSSETGKPSVSDPEIVVMHKELVLQGELYEESDQILPREFSLFQNQPNPFNPSTSIEYALPVDCAIDLSVYDILGKKVKTIDAGEKPAGYYSATWKGRDNDNNPVASGLYFIKLEAGDFKEVVKVQLIK
ncbi:T9SS type A sorting domain-containing protein [bacterium]|nr:T9SS type A sorting domain-containing protein [bacterium]